MESNLQLNPSPAKAEARAIDHAALDRALARARWERAEAVRAWVGRLSGWLRTRVVEPLRRTRQRRVELDTLLSLDDRTLADIGLHRDQIRAMVHGGVPLRPPAPQPAISPAPAMTRQPGADAVPAPVARAADDLAKAA